MNQYVKAEAAEFDGWDLMPAWYTAAESAEGADLAALEAFKDGRHLVAPDEDQIHKLISDMYEGMTSEILEAFTWHVFSLWYEYNDYPQPHTTAREFVYGVIRDHAAPKNKEGEV